MDKDVQKLGRVARTGICLGLGILMLWLPTYITNGPGLVLAAKGVVMLFGLLFLVKGLVFLWGLVIGSPLFTRKELRAMFEEEESYSSSSDSESSTAAKD